MRPPCTDSRLMQYQPRIRLMQISAPMQRSKSRVRNTQTSPTPLSPPCPPLTRTPLFPARRRQPLQHILPTPATKDSQSPHQTTVRSALLTQHCGALEMAARLERGLRRFQENLAGREAKLREDREKFQV